MGEGAGQGNAAEVVLKQLFLWSDILVTSSCYNKNAIVWVTYIIFIYLFNYYK
jgi:hypothetical protein